MVFESVRGKKSQTNRHFRELLFQPVESRRFWRLHRRDERFVEIPLSWVLRISALVYPRCWNRKGVEPKLTYALAEYSPVPSTGTSRPQIPGTETNQNYMIAPGVGMLLGQS
jgi:hypothetical protein